MPWPTVGGCLRAGSCAWVCGFGGAVFAWGWRVEFCFVCGFCALTFRCFVYFWCGCMYCVP